MLQPIELKRIAKERLRDAKVLYGSKRFQGAVYLCGYAMEMTLKLRICKTLRWVGFPSSSNEFEKLQSFKVHDLERLLHLSGRSLVIKQDHMKDWSIVSKWSPENRYRPADTVDGPQAKEMIESTEALVKVL